MSFLAALGAVGTAAASAAASQGAKYGMNELGNMASFAWNGKDLRRNVRYQKKMIRFANEQTKGMSLWSAKEMPAATMQGLKSAGLNPLLAAGGSTNVAPTVASSAASVPYSESFVPNSGGITADDANLFAGIASSAARKSAEKAESRATEEEAKARKEEADAKLDFLKSPEGKRAVKDKFERDLAPQNPWQWAADLVGSAKSVIPDSIDLDRFNTRLYNNMRRVEERAERVRERRRSSRESLGHAVHLHNDAERRRLSNTPRGREFPLKRTSRVKALMDGLSFTDY